MNLRKTGENIIWGGNAQDKGFKPLVLKMIGAALRPMGAFYGAAARARAALYRRGILHQCEESAPVISVGNLTLGGSGKTPLTMELARRFSFLGMKPAILTRGYGGTDCAIARVVLPENDQAEVGDEALLMARSLPGIPVVRGASRGDAAALAQEKFNPTVYLLDDGFGHLALKRDFDILVVDADRGFGNGRVFPAGPLREPLSAIARANAIIIRSDDFVVGAIHESPLQDVIEKTVRQFAPDIPILTMKAVIEGLVTEPGGEVVPLQAVENKRVFAFSGIGNPASFDRSVKEAGFQAVAHLAYPDHHKYSEKDIAEIAAAESFGAGAILTTEKDLVKFPQGRTGKMPLYALRIRMEVENFQWLMDLIKSKIKNR